MPIVFALLGFLSVMGVLVYATTPVLGFFYPFTLLMLIVFFAFAGLFDWRGFAIAFLVVCLGLFSTLPVFRANSYHALFADPVKGGEQTKGDYDLAMQAKLPEIDLDLAPLVSHDMAMQAAVKLLSQDSGLGSQVHVGRLEKQLVKGELVWVGFLEHSGFSRWSTNKTTPGYVVISAHNSAKANLVLHHKLRYLSSGYFGDDIERHVWAKYPGVGLTDFTPELDDEGHPYWVVTTYENKVGYSGEVATGVIVVDPESGEMNRYSIEEAPSWIDRIQPEKMLKEQVSDWGTYVHGWFNGAFSGKDVLVPSSSPDLVFGNDGRAYWYVGLTSAGRDNGVVGFLLVDSRTGKSVRYDNPGANEEVAAHAAQNVNPEKHYSATNPLVFRVEGEPTYVMALRDNTGIARAYGLVNLANYQIVAVAETLPQAARLYRSKFGVDAAASVSQKVSQKEVKGLVTRVGMMVSNGNSIWVFRVEGVKPILTGTIDISEDLPLLRANDMVEVSYAEGDRSTMVGVSKLSVVSSGGSAK